MAAWVSETFDIWTPILRGPSAMGFTLDNTLGVTSAPVGRSVTPGNIGPLWQDSRTPLHTPPPSPPLPGVPSSYLLNLLCPPWYGFRRPLSFGLHSGFFNYVVHFTCLCSFTPQDQGQERSHLIISKQEASTRPRISYVMLPYLLLQHIRQNKHYSICLKKKLWVSLLCLLSPHYSCQ